jgi:hypothetical protein
MTQEEIKKLDIDLFYRRQRLISEVNSYNKDFKRLEKVRPSRFARISPSKFDGGREGVMGLVLVEKLLERIITD